MYGQRIKTKAELTNSPAPLACSLAPERQHVAPVRSLESHREALAVATDPETAKFSELFASTQEGGSHLLPAKPMLTIGLLLVPFVFDNLQQTWGFPSKTLEITPSAWFG